jgi:Flp pilus assembly protein TadG
MGSSAAVSRPRWLSRACRGRGQAQGRNQAQGRSRSQAQGRNQAQGRSRDRGSSAVELAILAPALIFASLLIIQFALWFDVRHAALAAAQQGDLVAREDAFVNTGGWPDLARAAATSYYQGLDTSLLSRVTAQAAQGDGNTVSVTVSGKLTGVWPLTVTETVTGPVECFRTEVSQGAACG